MCVFMYLNKFMLFHKQSVNLATPTSSRKFFKYQKSVSKSFESTNSCLQWSLFVHLIKQNMRYWAQVKGEFCFLVFNFTHISFIHLFNFKEQKKTSGQSGQGIGHTVNSAHSTHMTSNKKSLVLLNS